MQKFDKPATLPHNIRNGDVIDRDDIAVYQRDDPLGNGDVPHHVGYGDIRTSGFPLVRDKVLDGHFRPVFQPGGKIGETAVQFCGILRVQFAPFGGLPGSFPYRRLVARQRGKRRKLCGPVAERVELHVAHSTEA